MLPNLEETIVALASAPGPGARAIARLSGSQSRNIVGQVVQTCAGLHAGERRCVAGQIALAGVAASLPCDVYFWPAPRTYTGQDMAEIHTLSCPPLVDLVVGQC